MNLGMAQIEISSGNPEENLQRISYACEELSQKNSDWILFPECSDYGWSEPIIKKSSRQLLEKSFEQALIKLSRQFNIYITCGLNRSKANKTYNSAITISPEKGIIHSYNKIYELDIVHEIYGQGQKLDVFETPFGNVGVIICADAFAEHESLLRSLCYMGADIILSPCAWAVPSDFNNKQEPYGTLWVNSYIPVAKKFKIWIAAVSNVGRISSGKWKGYKCIGSSLLISPGGQIEYQGPYGEKMQDLSIHEIPIIERQKRGTQWDQFGNREH